jgi:hypothetical protein
MNSIVSKIQVDNFKTNKANYVKSQVDMLRKEQMIIRKINSKHLSRYFDIKFDLSPNKDVTFEI